jgi:hypothetical protein
MQSNDPWQPILAELYRMLGNSEYSSAHPKIERLVQLIQAQRSNPNDVFLMPDEVINHLAQVGQEGAGVAFNQPFLGVQRDLIQAGRDINFYSASLINGSNAVYRIPIVLVVMNAREAKELASGTCFQGYPEGVLDDFRQLQILVESTMPDWVDHYQEEAKDWRPFKENQEGLTIEQLLTRAFNMIDEYKKPVIPSCLDIHAVNEPDSKSNNRRIRLWTLRKGGCVVIMDVVSMRHPVIQREFRRSLLDAFSNVLVVRIAPTSDALSLIQQMITLAEKHSDLEFYKRSRVEYDALCTEVVDSYNLLSWLKDHVTRLLPEKEKKPTGILGNMWSF